MAASPSPYYIKVRATTGAAYESVTETASGVFEIRVREKAQHNAANGRIIEVLAQALGIPSRSVRMVKGHRHQSKTFIIQ